MQHLFAFQRAAQRAPALPALAALATLATCGILASADARAGRPMITDDANIVDEQSCQLESWARNDKQHTEFWAVPACNAGGNLELALGMARSSTAEGTRNSDAVVQGKTLLRRLQTNDWGMGLTVGAVRHRLSEHGGADWYANVPVSLSLRDDRIRVHANLGWLREQDARAHHATWGLGSEIALDPRSALIAETFGEEQGRPLYQVGVRRWLVPDRIQLDATVGNRAGRDTGERWVSVGLRLLSPRFLP